MDKKIKVLIFPCGAENAIEAYYALKDVVNIEIWGASGKSDHGEYIFNNYIENVPYIDDPSFINSFKGIIIRHSIDVVIPTHDDVVLELARHENEFNALVLVHGLKQAEICRSKKLTYSSFKLYNFCCKTYSSILEIENYPVFIKPDRGQGAKGTKTINDIAEFASISDNLNTFVICEYLPGDEITVDCFTNFNGELLFAGPRKRVRVFNGISVRSSNIKLTDEILEIANVINKELSLNGLWYFQLKKDIFGKYKLLEISLRISGTMNLFRAKGINFPLLAIYNALKYDVEILENNFDIEVDRALINRYRHNIEYDTIYIDFDDTITRNGIVNPEVMMFLYNAKNNQKKLNLLTRHELDIFSSLEYFRIHKDLFDTITVIPKGKMKSEYINKHSNAVFIDNAYSERKNVHNLTGIPVFDVDAISVLLNWKI